MSKQEMRFLRREKISKILRVNFLLSRKLFALNEIKGITRMMEVRNYGSELKAYAS